VFFPQVFGFTHNGRSEYYNSYFNNSQYAEDADFERREHVYGGKVPQNSQLAWEREYHNLYMKYASDMVHLYYADDHAVASDEQLQNFHAELNKWLPNALPERHSFKTRASLSRFLADTIHVFTVRHEVYGTNTVKYALDPSIISSQVPIDFGLPSIEEYYSLLCVGYATSRVSFGKMFSPNILKMVEYFPEHQSDVQTVFQALQDGFKRLESEWTADQAQLDHNRDYFRNIPSDLETGAGY